MQRAVWIRLVLIGLLLIQIPMFYTPLTGTSLQEKEVTRLELPSPGVNLDTPVTCVLNNTYPNPLFNVPISAPGLYNFTMTLLVNYSDPWAGVDLYLRLYDSASQYAPHLDAYLPNSRLFDSTQWWTLIPGSFSQYFTEFMAVQPGSILIEFELDWNTPWDQLFVNFTVSQQYSFAEAMPASLGQNTTIQWTEDNAWNVTKFTIPSNDLYNITLYSQIPYTTTAGWTGVPDFSIFEPLALFDLIHGAHLGYSQWAATCNIPPGPSAGIATWNQITTIPLPAGDYYLVGKSNPFLFLNGTFVDLTIYVEQVPTVALGTDESIKLAFNATASINDAYVAVTVPQGYMVDFYLSNPEGGNWSITTLDAWQTFSTPPTYNYYEDLTTTVTLETRYHYGVALNQPVMTFNPASGLMGEQYFEPLMFLGTEVFYLDAVPQFANFPTMAGPVCFWNTFYLIVQGTPGFIGPPSSTFNISLHLDSTPISHLTTTTDITLPINQTIGPFYHGFLLTVESGVTYEISLTPTAYTSNGVVMLQVLSAQGQFYRDWGFGSYWPLSKAVGLSGVLGPGVVAAFSINETTAVRFMSVRNATMLVVALGTQPMLGVSDTTEIEVSLSVTEPTDYTIGSSDELITPTTEYDFTGFNVPLIEGYTYQVSLSIDYGSMFAAGIFFDDEGHTPLNIGIHDQWVMVDHTTIMSFTSNYTARYTGTVTFALIHQGNVHFSITLIDDKPPVAKILDPEWGAAFEAGDLVVNFTASDQIGLASLTVGIDTTWEAVPIDSTTHTFTITTPGLHTIYVVAEDTAGNIATDSITILILPDPTSWTLGRDAAFMYLIPLLIGAVAATGVICFLLGWIIKRPRKP